MIEALAWHAGEVRSVALADIAAELVDRDDGGFVWVHAESAGPVGATLKELMFDLPPPVQRALLAVETRPRCEPIGNGVFVNLRAPGAGDADEAAGDPLVSIRLWAEKGLLLTVALRPSTVLPLIDADFRAGLLHDPGDALIAMATHTAEAIDPVVASIGDELDGLECAVGPATDFAERRRVTALRTRAISLRRFVNPQRFALERLAQLPLDWIDDGERALVRDAADRFARMTEELESVRERAAVIHDELTDLRAEKIDARSLQIAIAAMIFLPLTFITGLLGMNVDGIPFARAPWAFWGVTGLCMAIAAAVSLWFAIRGWSRR